MSIDGRKEALQLFLESEFQESKHRFKLDNPALILAIVPEQQTFELSNSVRHRFAFHINDVTVSARSFNAGYECIDQGQTTDLSARIYVEENWRTHIFLANVLKEYSQRPNTILQDFRYQLRAYFYDTHTFFERHSIKGPFFVSWSIIELNQGATAVLFEQTQQVRSQTAKNFASLMDEELHIWISRRLVDAKTR